MKHIANKIITFVKSHPVVCIFLLAVVIRILVIPFFPSQDLSGTDLPHFPPLLLSGGDFALYNRIAESILLQGDFGGEPQKTYGSPFISPGWSFFLAGFYFLFGKSLIALLSVSIFFGGMIASGVYFLSRHFFNRSTAVLAGVIAALWPSFVIHTSAYGESLIFYTVLLLWSFFFFTKGVLGERWLLAAFSGILLGFAALVEPIAFFISAVFILWALIVRFSFRTFALTSIFLVTFLLVIAPWSYRNLSVSESLSETPLISKGELQLIAPNKLFSISKLAIRNREVLSGLTQMFVFPTSIYMLDQYNDRSYKETIADIFLGQSVELTRWEIIIISIKIVINTLHLLLLGLSIAGMFVFRSNKFVLLTVLLLGYTATASIGFGILQGGNFQNVRLLNDYLFPIMPFIIIIAAAFLSKKSVLQLFQKDNIVKACKRMWS